MVDARDRAGGDLLRMGAFRDAGRRDVAEGGGVPIDEYARFA
jgi:hypothetical protein